MDGSARSDDELMEETRQLCELVEGAGVVEFAPPAHPISLPSQRTLIDLMFNRSFDGLFLMMLDRPLAWDDSVDKEAALDYAFEHLHISRANPAMAAQYGATEDQIVGLTPADLFAHDTVSGREVYRRLFDNGALRSEFSHSRMGGHPLLVLADYVCIRNVRGMIIGHFGVQRDITDEREKEEQFRLFYQESPLGYQSLDVNGSLLEVNPAWLSLLGYERDEVIGRSFADFLTSDSVSLFRTRFPRFRIAGQVSNVPFEMLGKDGSTVRVEIDGRVSYNPDGSFRQTHCVVRDVTEQKMILDAIAIRSEFERLIARISTSFISLPAEALESGIRDTLKEIGSFVDADRSYVFQLSDDLTLADNTHEWCADGIEPAMEDLQHIEVAEELPWFIEFMKRGEVFNIPDVSQLPSEACRERKHFKAQGIRSLIVLPMTSHDRLIGFMGFDAVRSKRVWSEDTSLLLSMVSGIITGAIQRSRAEHMRHVSEQLYKTLVDTAAQPIFVVTDSGVFDFMNPAAAQALAATPADIVGKNLWELFPSKYADQHMAVVNKALKNGRLIVEETETAVPGGKRWYHSRVQPLADDSDVSNKVLVILTDITEARKAERQLKQRQADLAHANRITTLGEMASGIAHELNQPLCSIENYAGACRRLIVGSEGIAGKVIDALQEISCEAQRAGEIIRRMRTLVSKGTPRESAFNINDLIDEAMKIEAIDARERDVAIVTELVRDLPELMGDPVQIEQVILNMVRNAIDAIDETADGNRLVTLQSCLADGGDIEVAVIDTGAGLSPGAARKVFDPFYTTKAEGLGVGLWVSRSIIESHGGRIWAEGNAGKGAAFRFTLPVRQVCDLSLEELLKDEE